MTNFRFYMEDDGMEIDKGHMCLQLVDLNYYFSHSRPSLDVRRLIFKPYGIHYKTGNTLYEVRDRKKTLLGYLELLK